MKKKANDDVKLVIWRFAVCSEMIGQRQDEPPKTVMVEPKQDVHSIGSFFLPLACET